MSSTLSGRLVQSPLLLGKNSRPTIFSRTELLPLLWLPIATICGSETVSVFPTVAKISSTLDIIAIIVSIHCGSSLLELVSLPFLLSDCSDGIFLKVKVQLFLIVTDKNGLNLVQNLFRVMQHKHNQSLRHLCKFHTDPVLYFLQQLLICRYSALSH